MEFGVLTFIADGAIGAVDLGTEVESLGFESLWVSEHSHIPVSRLSPFGGRPGAPPLPDHYRKGFDCFVGLAAIAATTKDLRLGTGVCLVAQHDPLWLGKAVASLDSISGGRFEFGVGYGWNKEEMANHGIAYEDRRAVLRENILAMQQLWTRDVAEFSGEHVRFDASWSWPKPSQRPHPPITIGAGPGPKTFAHIIEFADWWMPNYGRYELERGIEDLRRASEAAGRDPDSIGLAITNAPTDLHELERLEALGVGRALFSVKPGVPDEMIPVVARCAEVARGYRE